ncbi:hypothetical protein CCGE525_25745 (plasmid) [Rhizobium jaguaris]|uniref:Uncharacterized protein n=1 Tax=Rhizobium jaguaris TaxID=1312183 RepID=A0A387G222_9HYPH|nr:hypothetical protein CCGE525_25745 [Rhizobium jaguaris]
MESMPAARRKNHRCGPDAARRNSMTARFASWRFEAGVFGSDIEARHFGDREILWASSRHPCRYVHAGGR